MMIKRPNFNLESQFGGLVAGVDEVGRGPWAGPVVSAAVVFKTHSLPDELFNGINDSKKLTAKKRQSLVDQLLNSELCIWGIAEASVAEIDQFNIRQATFMSMQRAVKKLGYSVNVALVDGNATPQLDCKALPVIKGDQQSLSIAAASILAKVHRDGLMVDYAKRYPGYAWETNMGYGTKDHQNGLAKLGPTPLHRTSFAPIRNLLAAA